MKNYKNRIQQFVTISSQYLESLNRIYKIKTRRHQNIITITNNIFFVISTKGNLHSILIKEFFIFFFSSYIQVSVNFWFSCIIFFVQKYLMNEFMLGFHFIYGEFNFSLLFWSDWSKNISEMESEIFDWLY